MYKQKTYNFRKRLISVIMCLVMILLCLPAHAKAEVKMLGNYSLTLGEKGNLDMSSISETSTTWTSTNPSVATVSGSGLHGTVTPHKAGTTEIHIQCNTLGKTYGVYVTVKEKKSSSKKSSGKKISLNKTNLVIKKGKSGKLKLLNAKASKVKWKSKSKKIATVSKKGVVKGKKKGKTKVIATYKKKRYTCKVTVNAGKSKVKITMTKLSKKKRTVKAGPTKTVSVGNLKNDGYKITIPKGAFDKNTKVKITTSGKKVLISVPGQKYVRLNEPVKIQFKLSKNVPNESIDYWKGVYFFGKQKTYMDPDISQLRKGILSFETVHFSPYSGEELSDKELRARAAYFDAVNSVSKDCQNELMGSVLEDGMGKVVESLGFPDDSPDKKKILKALGKSTKFVELVRAGAEGDANAFTGKTAELLTDIIIENADSTKVGYLGAAVSSVPDVLEKVNNNDYKGASEAVLKAVTSNIPYVKAVQFTASIVGTTINYYVDSETEAAYKAYYGMLKDGESGYSMKNGDGWNIIEQQMACPLRQMNDNAIKEYAAAKGVSTWSLSKEEQDKIRAMVKNNLLKQFEYRYNHQTEIEQRQAETQNFLKAAMKEGLLRRGDSSVAFGRDDDYMMRLTRLLNIRDNIRAMLGGKDFVDYEKTGAYFKTASDRAAYNNKIYAKLVALWIEKGWVKSNRGTEGRRAVAKYLAEHYGVGVSIKPGSTLSMKMNEKASLSLKGTYGTVKWQSGNTKIATVDTNGVVTPLRTGSVIITAFYGSKSYTCKITISSGTPGVVEFPRVRRGHIRDNSTSGSSSLELTGKAITNPEAITWSADGGKITNKGDYASFEYTSLGTYNITAVYNGITYKMHIEVVTEVQQPGGGYTVWPTLLFDTDRIE